MFSEHLLHAGHRARDAHMERACLTVKTVGRKAEVRAEKSKCITNAAIQPFLKLVTL